MTFSIIVPIYNVEKYLNKCIDSILSQTYTNFELILVDDGSPDNCPMICDEYAKKDDRIIVVHKENGGLSSARNAGLDIATGKYIYFCDSDDYVEPELLETCIEYMEQGYDLFCFRHRQIFETDGQLNIPVVDFFGEKNISLLQDKLQILIDFATYVMPHEAWNKMYRRDIIEKHKIRFEDTKKVLAEDMCFCLYYLTFCEKIYSSNKIMYNYLQRDNSLYAITKENIFPINKINELLICYIQFLDLNNCNELLKDFPVLYYIIFNYFLTLHFKGGVLELQKVLREQIDNREFLTSNYKHIFKRRKTLYNILKLKETNYLYETKRRLIQVKFYINNNYILFKIKTKILIKFYHLLQK